MISLVYRLFRKRFQQLAHRDRERLTKERLLYWFTDDDGNNYFKFPTGMALPLERLGYLKMYYSWLSAGLTGEELDMCLDVIDEAIQAGIKDAKVAAKVGAMTSVMRERRQYAFNVELYYNIVAIQAIREDEPIEAVNTDIQMQKVEAFKRMTAGGGAYFFFQEKLSGTPLSLSGISEEEFNELVRESQVLKMELQQIAGYLRRASELQKTTSGSNAC